jgi:hypothetical protein
MLFVASNGNQKALNRKWSAYKHQYNKKFISCTTFIVVNSTLAMTSAVAGYAIRLYTRVDSRVAV